MTGGGGSGGGCDGEKCYGVLVDASRWFLIPFRITYVLFILERGSVLKKLFDSLC